MAKKINSFGWFLYNKYDLQKRGVYGKIDT